MIQYENMSVMSVCGIAHLSDGFQEVWFGWNVRLDTAVTTQFQSCHEGVSSGLLFSAQSVSVIV